LTIRNGHAYGSLLDEGYGLLLGAANVTLNDCVITGNTGTSFGGAISSIYGSSATTITLNRCTVSNNSAVNGAGLCMFSSATVIISNCSFSGNISSGNSGALYLSSGITTISGSTFSGNSSGGTGGAIGNGLGGDQLTIINSTIANNNSTGAGGGINIDAGSVFIYNSTIASNTAGGAGGGIGGIVALLSSTIVFGNTDNGNGPDVSGTIGASNQSLIGNSAGASITANNGSLLNVNPMLGPLAGNGGPTQTMAIGGNSPAKDVGNNVLALTYDQRGAGFVRNVGSGTDIGAFENQSATPVLNVMTVKIDDGTAQRSMVTSLTVTFSEAVTFTGAIADAFLLNRDSAPPASAFAEQGGVTGLVNLNAVQAGNVVTLTFNGAGVNPIFGVGGSGNLSLPDGRYTLTIDANLMGVSGAKLDGDGDGDSPDNYVLASAAAPNPPTNIFRLFGDANGDGMISAFDFLRFRQGFGGVDHRFDYDGDGVVAASDFIRFRQRFGGSI
jgi:hypothetical protein